MEWIRDRRKHLSLSQDDLVRLLQLEGFDVGRSSISHWEKGRYAPPLGNTEFVRVLARVLKLDSATVLEYSGYSLQSQHSEISERLARLVDTLPEQKQLLALKLVEQLLD